MAGRDACGQLLPGISLPGMEIGARWSAGLERRVLVTPRTVGLGPGQTPSAEMIEVSKQTASRFISSKPMAI